MLRAIYNNLTENGMGLVTVPSLEYILQYNGYYELIHDHIAYYTFDSLRRLLEDNGFQVLEEEMINRDTISMIVRKGEKKTGAEKAEKNETQRIDVSGLRESVCTIREEISQLISRLDKEGKKLAIWGASHQGFTLAATTALEAYSAACCPWFCPKSREETLPTPMPMVKPTA